MNTSSDNDYSWYNVTGRDLAELLIRVHSDKKIAAIKEFRSLTGLGLKESKEAIDAAHGRAKVATLTEKATELISAMTTAASEGRTRTAGDYAYELAELYRDAAMS
jgi:translation elongation factor EF-Ts